MSETSIKELSDLKKEYDDIVKVRIEKCHELLREVTSEVVCRENKSEDDKKTFGHTILRLPYIKSFNIQTDTYHDTEYHTDETYVKSVTDDEKGHEVVLSDDRLLGRDVRLIKQAEFDTFVDEVQQRIIDHFTTIDAMVAETIAKETNRAIASARFRLNNVR